jgi:sulfite reductase (NADPH) flavoprotein alpha-component
MALLPPPVRSRLASLHRWMALALSPVLLSLVVTGAILALDPLLSPAEEEPQPPAASAAPPAERLAALLAKVDAEGKATYAALGDDGRTARVGFGRSRQVFDLATARPVPPEGQRAPGAGLFGIVKRIHERLWFGAEALVLLASIAMGLLVLVGPLLSGLARPRAARGWHVFTGWVLWPLLALPLASLLAMKLAPSPFDAADRSRPAPSLQQALQQAAPLDLSRLKVVQALPGAAVIIAGGIDGEDHRWLVGQGAPRSLDSQLARWGHRLHEGTWGGRLGGLVSLLSALGLCGLLATGVLSWWRLRRKARAAA